MNDPHEHALTCEQALDAIHARFDDALTDDDDAALDAHLATCDACREFEAGLPFVCETVRRLPDIGLPDDALDAVFAATTRRRSAPLLYRLMTRWQTAVAAAVVAFALLLGTLTPRRSPPAPSPEVEQAYAEAQFVVQLTGRVLNEVQHTALDEIGEIRATPAVQRVSGLWSIATDDTQH